MTEPTLEVAHPVPQRRRFRFGIRGMLIGVLALGIPLALFANLQRQAAHQEALVAELERDGIRVNHRRPTLLCFALMKVLSTHSSKVEARFSRWINRGWFYSPKGFNAGRLPEAKVDGIVDRLNRLGDVSEVTYTDASLSGLKLFYIGPKPLDNLGPHAKTCVIRHYPVGRISTSGRQESNP